MAARTVHFTGPRAVEVRSGAVPEPAPGEVLVTAEASAISPGTELLIYRGEAPTDLPADPTIDALPDDLSFPTTYGYATVGRVTDVGDDVPGDRVGERIFAFHPHASHLAVEPGSLLAVPDGLDPADAALFPTVETAVTLAMDAAPRVGERVAVLGQGLVGLATTAILSRFPLGGLVTVDRHPARRRRSEALGADASLEPGPPGPLIEGLGGPADAVVEVTGDPAVLDLAIDLAAHSGRVVVGSWYGTRRAPIDLGGRFHRERIAVRSSQVSTLDPALSGRWTRERRRDVAWDLLPSLDPARLVTHRFPVERAPEAYRLLDEQPEEALGVLLTYGGG